VIGGDDALARKDVEERPDCGQHAVQVIPIGPPDLLFRNVPFAVHDLSPDIFAVAAFQTVVHRQFRGVDERVMRLHEVDDKTLLRVFLVRIAGVLPHGLRHDRPVFVVPPGLVPDVHDVVKRCIDAVAPPVELRACGDVHRVVELSTGKIRFEELDGVRPARFASFEAAWEIVAKFE
jgi:hypothetical protein